jgi:hypothetical protein
LLLTKQSTVEVDEKRRKKDAKERKDLVSASRNL